MAKNQVKWSKEEIKKLTDIYNNNASLKPFFDDFPKRTQSQVHLKAKHLKLTKQKKWHPEEISFAIRSYLENKKIKSKNPADQKTYKTFSKKYNRTKNSFYNLIRYLKLKSMTKKQLWKLVQSLSRKKIHIKKHHCGKGNFFTKNIKEVTCKNCLMIYNGSMKHKNLKNFFIGEKIIVDKKEALILNIKKMLVVIIDGQTKKINRDDVLRINKV